MIESNVLPKQHLIPCNDDESSPSTCWDLDTRAFGALLDEIKSRRARKQGTIC